MKNYKVTRITSTSAESRVQQNEILVLEKRISKFSQLMTLLKKRGPHWTDEVLEQTQEKFKKLDSDSPLYLHIHFSNGKSTLILSVSTFKSSFERQNFLRKHLDAFFSKSTSPFLLDISRLKEANAKNLFDEVTVLFHTLDWETENYKSKSKKEPISKELFLNSKFSPSQFKKLNEKAAAQSNALNLVRTLSNMPGNMLHPSSYRKYVENRKKDGKYKTRFYGRKELKQMGAGAFLAVTDGLKNDEGGILHLSQTRKPNKVKGKLTLVGKGICFDTGGYNIKTGNYMAEMHRDMTGSAVALGVFEMVHRLNLPLEVDAYLALAENIISDDAYRPTDVVTASNGKTIEVVDTDAEGRMVLSDTLVLASQKQPDLLLNFATLTGAAVRSIGTKRSAIFSNSTKLQDMAIESGDNSGERVWAFPHGEDYLSDLRSDVADIYQCNPKPNADHIYAATFLSQFIKEKTNWVHMDLSAECHGGGLGLIKTDITGFGVRWSLDLISKFFRL